MYVVLNGGIDKNSYVRYHNSCNYNNTLVVVVSRDLKKNRTF